MKTLELLLESTIYSSVLFAAILLLKLCFRNKMSPFLHFAIWGLLIARLLIPVTLESSVHLIVLYDSAQPVAIQQTQPAASQADILPATAVPDIPVIRSQVQRTQPTATFPNARVSLPAALPVQDILLGAWLSGVGIGLLYLAILHRSLCRRIRRNAALPSQRLSALFEEAKRELGIRANLRLVCLYECGTPALLFPRTVLMPLEALLTMSDEQVKFALRHELTHFKRGDQAVGLLLCVLKAVYWFNPVVWLAFPMIRSDMETACDSAVVRKMDKRQRSRYASLVVTLFTRPAHRQLVLGMAQGVAKRMAERRIKGIFMASKSGKGVRLASAILALVLLVACFTTACQPSPTKAAVVGKDADVLEEKIRETATPQAAGDSSTHCDLSFKSADGAVTVRVNADAVVPERLPVVRVQPYFIQMEQIKAATQVLFRGAQAYETGGGTKSEIQKALLAVKHDLQQYVESDGALKDHYNGNQAAMDAAKARYEWQISAYEKLYASAPEVAARKMADWAFHPAAYYQDVTAYGDLSGNDAQSQSDRSMLNDSKVIQLSSEFDGSYGFFEADNLDTSGEVQHYLGFFSGSTFSSDGSLVPNWKAGDFQPIDATQAEVVAMVRDALIKMGIQGMSLNQIHVYGKPDPTAAPASNQEAMEAAAGNRPAVTNAITGEVYTYSLMFVPSYEGVPTVDTGRSIELSQDQYGPTYNYENLLINVGCVAGASGPVITSLQWNNPMQAVDVENGNAKVLSLKDALDVFQSQMKREYTLDRLASDAAANGAYEQYKGRIQSAEIDITNVTLGLVRIRVPNDPKTYRMVPAWVFQGAEKLGMSGLSKPIDSPRTLDGAYSYLVVNAIDGSIIDPSLGH